MKAKSMILIVIALGCGLVASIGISQVVSKKGKAEVQQVPKGKVLTALTDINIGDKLTAENVRLEDWPADRIGEGHFSDIEEIEGEYASARMYKGEQIIAKKLMSTGTQYAIPAGFRVIPVKIERDSVADFIKPGDRVDVAVYLKSTANSRVPQVKTFLTNVRIFAINSKVERSPEEEKSTGVKSMSVLLKPEQAEKITLAQEIGKLRLLLRNQGESEEAETVGVDLSELIAQNRPDAASDPVDTTDEPKGDSFVDWIQKNGVSNMPELNQPSEPAFQMDIITPEGVQRFQWNGDDEPQQVVVGTPAAAASRPAPPVLPTPPVVGTRPPKSNDGSGGAEPNGGIDDDDLSELEAALQNSPQLIAPMGN